MAGAGETSRDRKHPEVEIVYEVRCPLCGFSLHYESDGRQYFHGDPPDMVQFQRALDCPNEGKIYFVDPPPVREIHR